MKRHIICFGDSNTHGYCADPADCADGALHRFNEAERWTCLLQRALGHDYLVVEEGLPGRTTVFDDPICGGMCGLDYLYPCLKSHEPVSLLVLMLGTNDTKVRLDATATAIAAGLRRLVHHAQHIDCWGQGAPNILIMAPPPIPGGVHHSPVALEMGAGCVEKSEQLPPLLAAVAAELGCHFVDNGDCALNQIDYMHLTREGHSNLADKLALLVPTLLSLPSDASTTQE